MEMGHTIARLRSEKKISQKQLAKELNVSAGLVGLWETNKRLPSLDCFISLIDFFSISADVLLDKDRQLSSLQYQHMLAAKETSSFNKLYETFNLLNEDNQDILIGESKKLLKQQRLEEKNCVQQPIRQAK